VTALTVTVALAIASQCAPAVDPHMLVGIAQQESGLETMTLHDNASGKVLHGAGVIDAATRLIAAGHSVDLGAWQINSRNLSLLGLRIADAFDACKSAAAAARLIELFSRYNTAVHLGVSRTVTRRRLWPPSTRWRPPARHSP
jgi:type IV secretion system protein VirB1